MFSGIIKKLFWQEDNNDLLAELQEKIGYRFKNIELLEQAVTHKSFANEMRHENSFGNERLEFLGDAVLGLVISHILMDGCQQCSEGELSRMRAAVVNTDALSSLALQLGFDEHILLSRGEEESMGRTKKSILANVYEAIVAAVYYDGGYKGAFSVIKVHFSDLLEDVSQKGVDNNYKSKLQEYSQKTYDVIPEYVVVSESGPEHNKFFNVQVFINEKSYGKGSGTNKKNAEQEAAKAAMEELSDE